MVIYMYSFSLVSIYFLCVYELGAACKPAADVFFQMKKALPDFVIISIFKICIYVYWDLSKKMRADKSLILAVLARPDLSWRADW